MVTEVLLVAIVVSAAVVAEAWAAEPRHRGHTEPRSGRHVRRDQGRPGGRHVGAQQRTEPFWA